MEAVIIRLQAVKNKTGLSRSTIYELIANDKFPKQVHLSTKSVGWILSEVDQWVDDRISERDTGVLI